jgi:hypothetical protein
MNADRVQSGTKTIRFVSLSRPALEPTQPHPIGTARSPTCSGQVQIDCSTGSHGSGCSVVNTYTTCFNILRLCILPTQYLCVPYGSHSKQRLFPVRYALNLYMLLRRNVKRVTAIREMLALRCDNHTKHITTLCGENAGGAQRNQCALKR